MPTWGEIAQIITAFAAVGAFLNSWRNSRKIEAVHQSTNGKMETLIAEVRTSEHAKGMKDEKDKTDATIPLAQRI